MFDKIKDFFGIHKHAFEENGTTRLVGVNEYYMQEVNVEVCSVCGKIRDGEHVGYVKTW